MEDIRGRIAQRDGERRARLDREKGVFLSKERAKRSATDVAAASRCACGTSPADCPLRDHAHYVLRCSVPGAADSEGPRVEEFEYMSGQPVDTPARTAFLQAARALADLPSDKEAVFLALLKEGLCGFLVDDIASVQGSPLSEDAVHILIKVGVLLNQRFLYREALRSNRDLAEELRHGPTADSRSHVITNLEEAMAQAKTLLTESPVAQLIHALGCGTEGVGTSAYGQQLGRLEYLVPLLATQALYRLKLVSGEFPVQHYFGGKVQALRGSQTLWDILNEFGVASTKKMLLRAAGACCVPLHCTG